ncbi:MAG: hypothetical protein M1836_002747 [Candelina mexicana]|nr:MAG: hypothetical protein M1836_002747 [Candelina mexicana]
MADTSIGNGQRILPVEAGGKTLETYVTSTSFRKNSSVSIRVELAAVSSASVLAIWIFLQLRDQSLARKLSFTLGKARTTYSRLCWWVGLGVREGGRVEEMAQ